MNLGRYIRSGIAQPVDESDAPSPVPVEVTPPRRVWPPRPPAGVEAVEPPSHSDEQAALP